MARKQTQLVELLYVDEVRLEWYYKQLKQRPRNLPSYSASVGVPGVRFSMTWSPERHSDLVSMIDAVRNHLRSAGLLAETRPSAQDRLYLLDSTNEKHAALFREEHVELYTVIIPIDRSNAFLQDGMTFWISTANTPERDVPDVLFLIENFPK